MTTVTTLLAFLVLPVGVYELVIGRMLSGPYQRGMNRWLTTPARIRIASLGYIGFSVSLLIYDGPLALPDLVAGIIGLILGSLVVLGMTHNTLTADAAQKTLD